MYVLEDRAIAKFWVWRLVRPRRFSNRKVRRHHKNSKEYDGDLTDDPKNVSTSIFVPSVGILSQSSRHATISPHLSHHVASSHISSYYRMAQGLLAPVSSEIIEAEIVEAEYGTLGSSAAAVPSKVLVPSSLCDSVDL